jgi:hypothetical protein
MDSIIQRLQIEALKSQLSLMQLGHAYLSQRCDSADCMAESTWKMLSLLENVRQERAVLECVLELSEGKVRPMWG